MTTATAPVQDAAAAALRQTLWVGDWQVAGELNQILRGGAVLRIEPKAMAVLLHLASRPQAVVSRDELLAAIWPGVVVGDNALTQVVIKLRRALGDTAREPTYVQAVAKKGYRLVAAVRRDSVSSVESKAREGAVARRRRPILRTVAALAFLLMALIAVLVLQRTDSDQPRPPGQGADHEMVRGTAPSLVVEAFEVLDPQPGRLPLARAIAADLVTDLSKVSGLRVIERTRLADRPPAVALHPPRYALSGTIQQDGERLRLNLLLTDIEASRVLWSERLDRQVQDLFEVQDSLVARVLEVLPVKVSEAEAMRLAQRSTRNLRAYESFVRAQAALLVRRPEQNVVARSLYWQALGRDPAFARAYAGLALTHALDYQQRWTPDGDKALARASDFAQAALRMRPDMPESHWVLAFVGAQHRQHADALRNVDQALQLNPSYADAYALKGGILTYVGKPAQAVAQLQTALRLSPDAGSLYFLLLGRAYYFLGDTEQARVNLQRTLERNPENLEARIYLAATLWQVGDRDAARWQLIEVRTLDPGFSGAAWLAAYPLTAALEKRQLQAALLAMGLN